MSRSVENMLFAQPVAKTHTLMRLWSVLAALAVMALLLVVAWRFHAAGQLDSALWSFFTLPTTWSFLAKGLLGTAACAALAAVIALLLGLVLLAGRLSAWRCVRWPSVALIELLRGTPALLLIYVCFLLLPTLGWKLSTYWMLTLPIALSTAAVVAEVYRAGVLAVPRGQSDAARSLGMKPLQVFRWVVFPQALRFILPALVAQLVIVVKDTTLGYVVTYGELMQNAKVLIANYQSLVPVYLVVAVLYCLLNYAISAFSQRVARAMQRQAV